MNESNGGAAVAMVADRFAAQDAEREAWLRSKILALRVDEVELPGRVLRCKRGHLEWGWKRKPDGSRHKYCLACNRMREARRRAR